MAEKQMEIHMSKIHSSLTVHTDGKGNQWSFIYYLLSVLLRESYLISQASVSLSVKTGVKLIIISVESD